MLNTADIPKGQSLEVVSFRAHVSILGIIDEVDVTRDYVFAIIKTRDNEADDLYVPMAIPKARLNTGRAFNSFVGRGLAGEGILVRYNGELVVLISDYRVLSKTETKRLLEGEVLVIR